MNDFITLSCPSCGAKLEITQDIERFACTHCGREHIVKRSGGVISLSPVIDAIKQVGIGVDKTAAELAIVRLQKEIALLQAKRANVSNSLGIDYLLLFSIGLLIVGILSTLVDLCGNVSGGTDSYALAIAGIVMIIIAVIILVLSSKNRSKQNEIINAEVKQLNDQITSKTSELEHFHNLVSQ